MIKTLVFRRALRRFTLLVVAILAVSTCGASTFQILHKFTGTDGLEPVAGPTLDSAGNLYGTTWIGGNLYCNCGTLYKIGAAGKFTVLYKFHGPTDAMNPSSRLVRDAAGDLYGATDRGGAYAYGAIFKFSSGIETVIHTFGADLSEGTLPVGITPDGSGNFYGATRHGGQPCPRAPHGCGVIFKFDQSGLYSVLHTFTEGADGGDPIAPPILDAKGNLYGTTMNGGNLPCGFEGCGVVYKLDANGTYHVLKTFNGFDGQSPKGRLVMDKAGNLYGVTPFGGSSTNCNGGCGVVFKLSPNPDGTWTYTIVHDFDAQPAAIPVGSLAIDKYGTLWGATVNAPNGGRGTIFKMPRRPDGSRVFRVVHKFIGKPAADPLGDFAIDQSGHIYGATMSCGDTAGCTGVVFKITP